MLVANAKTRHAALLIAGSEERYLRPTVRFQEYLSSRGVQAMTLLHPKNPSVLSSVRMLTEAVSSGGVLLIVINGHGSKTGFETSSFTGRMSYRRLVAALPKEPMRVQFIDSSCYGHFLIKELIGRRSGLYTGVITGWEGFKATYGDLTIDVARAWANGVLPEEVITRQIYAGNQDSEFLGVQRWGAIFDDFFVTRRSQQSGLKVAM